MIYGIDCAEQCLHICLCFGQAGCRNPQFYVKFFATVTGGSWVFQVSQGVRCTIQNGKISASGSQSTAIANYGDVTIENCTLWAGEKVFQIFCGTMTVRDCTVKSDYDDYAHFEWSADAETKLILEGTVAAEIAFPKQPFTFRSEFGTIRMPKDAFPDMETENYNIVDNGDGTVTVTKK